MKKLIAALLLLLCVPAQAQNYLSDDGTFHSVVEGTTTGQLLGNVSGSMGGITVGTGLLITAGTLAVTGAPPTGAAGGDLTGTYPNPTLAGVLAAGGPTGSATVAPIITYDAKGRLTVVSSATVTPAVGSITGLGTGVVTALGVNIGSAGAFVTFNGALGTPSSGTLTNATGLPTTGLTGTLQAAQEPAHTGDVTNSAGSLALTIASNAVTLAKLATQATNTVLGNATSGTAVPTALSVGSCSSASSALIWTTNTGFGCNTSITATTATNATNTAITDDTTTNATMFPTWVTANTGNLPQKVTSTKMSFNPSTGALSSTTVIAANDTTGGFQIRNSGGTADAQFYEGAGGTLVFKMGTVNAWALATNALATVLDYSSTTASAITVTPNLFYWAGTTADTSSTDATLCRRTSNGQILTGTGALGICLGTSGAQFKTALSPMAAGIDDLMKVNFQNFRYRDGFGDSGAAMQYGTTAQEVAQAIPDIARRDENGELINYDSGALLFVGLHAIQQLKAENDNLRACQASWKCRIFGVSP